MPVPEAEALVGALRLQYDWSAARGVPAHITVLFPFLADDELDHAALAAVLAAHRAFDFELASVERFGDDVTYLAPVPDAPFRALTEAVWRRWPARPPYERRPRRPDPAPDDRRDEPRRARRRGGPTDCCRAREVLLIVETEPDGAWAVLRRYALGVA